MSERARSRRAAWRRPQNAGEFLDDGVADPPARRVAAVRSDDGANVDRAAFARLGGILAAREIGEGRRTQARHEVARLAPIHRRNEHDAVFQRRRRPGKNLAELLTVEINVLSLFLGAIPWRSARSGASTGSMSALWKG